MTGSLTFPSTVILANSAALKVCLSASVDKIPKNSILAKNFSLSQGNKDKSNPCQEIRETRIRFQSWQRGWLKINYPCMLCMKIANNSPLFPDFRFQIYYSKFICYRCQDMSQKKLQFSFDHENVMKQKSLLEIKCKIWFAQTKEEHGKQVFDYRNYLWLRSSNSML